ncbi:Basic-leucine zipper (bZIP) transcription factor family protein [Striga hermonthica]|uniref:Basic-leucine zipper (BZIP) transcription factor family protein n=1 Tax=Striga hermonthica TaxID=68872 RepID=A0A9N7NBX5_STRHE|nr:Basic-leucine zipper (bZIP) transcription factor family protein [Striga hermonthica]
MDDILRNIYSDSDAFAQDNNAGDGAGGGEGSAADGGGEEMGIANGSKTVDEMWSEIVSGSAEPRMTLEDFLAKAGAGDEEDARVPEAAVTVGPAVPGVFGMDAIVMNPASAAVQFAPPPAVCVQNGFGVEFGSGRGRRRVAVEEAPLDKATQQKQRRMIKNRESAARSRERKQAYTVELESLVTHLEEENARLLKEELMENLIPLVEKRRPSKVLRRVHSMEW